MIHKVTFRFSFDDIPYEKIGDQYGGKFVSGVNLTFLNCTFEKGAIVPKHEHMNEQISYVLKGVLKGTVGGKDYILKKGDGILVPPHTPHQWEALEETTTLEIFSPVREGPSNKGMSHHS